jgi:LysR family cys regulon transcriptional activator
MNLHQFRFVQEAVRRNLNLTETAKALFTSQPGVSKAILELEEELGVDIFARHGKRLKRVTEPGQEVLKSIEIIMREVANLQRIGDEFSKQDAGTLSIATTHTQARYFLPEPVALLRKRYPKVQLVLHQGMPEQVARMLLDDVAEIGLATESLALHEGLVTLPCYEWQHVLVVPTGHPLAAVEQPTLQQLAEHTLVLYHPTVTGRTRIDQAFERAQLKPLVALEAIDSDVIITYVRLGLGIGIVAESAMAAEPPGSDLVARPLGHLIGSNITRVAFKRGAWLRRYVVAFAEMLSPRLSPALIGRAMQGDGTDFSL